MKFDSIAKISRPFIAGIVPRKRLFELLDNSLKRPVVWVSAPAGSGKTTLVASYLDSRKMQCLWYQLDEGDADISTFFYYTGLAAKKANPRKKKPLPLLTPEYFGGIPVFTRRYFEELYSSLTHHSSHLTHHSSIIVFDNYQEVPSDSQFHEMIANGLEVIPEGIKVVIISRTEPPPHLIKYKANNKMEFIGWNDIKFTIEDTVELIGRSERPDINAVAKALHEKTDGWAAGLTLMLKSVTERQNRFLNGLSGFNGLNGSNSPLHHCRTDEVFGYFATEVFDKSGEKLREFLLKTSFLPHMTAALAENLTGMNGAQSILSDLTGSNYFTDWRPGTVPVYQYHSLFREFLIAKANNIFSRDEISSIQYHAAALLEESGQSEDAMALYADVGDWEKLAGLILSSADAFITGGRNKTLEGWLRRLPAEKLKNNPELLYWLGMCRVPFDTEKSRKYFERSFEASIRQGKTSCAMLSWAGAVETIFFERGDFSRMDKWAERLNGIMKTNRFSPSCNFKNYFYTQPQE